MRKLLISVTAAAAILAAASPAFPSTYEFSFDGASATFPSGACSGSPCTDSIVGDFTITINNPVFITTLLLTAIDVTLSGNVDAGSYNFPAEDEAYVTSPEVITDVVGVGAYNCNISLFSCNPTEIEIAFSTGLDPAMISQLDIFPPGGAFSYDFSSNVGGSADPAAAPLPAAFPLFATALGGLGLLGWRRKRKAIAA
jgi:hypothetical protein